MIDWRAMVFKRGGGIRHRRRSSAFIGGRAEEGTLRKGSKGGCNGVLPIV
jgi:hypothetical protein